MGVYCNVPAEFGLLYVTVGLGISAVLSLTAVMVRCCVSPAPALMPVRFTVCWPELGRIGAGSAIASIVGGRLACVPATGIDVVCPARLVSELAAVERLPLFTSRNSAFVPSVGICPAAKENVSTSA